MSARVKRKTNKIPIILSSDSESDVNLDTDSDFEETPIKKIKVVEKNEQTNVITTSESSILVKKYIPKKTTNTVTEFQNFDNVSSTTNNKAWSIDQLLAEREFISPESSKNIVQLFENDNTIPFICRYRRDLTGNITPEKLRNIKNSYIDIIKLQKRSETMINQMQKDKILNNNIKEELLSAKTIEELEFLYAPYKPASKGSLADRAKALGLESYAEQILYGNSPQVNLQSLVKSSIEGKENIEKISCGIINIISHIISKNTEVLEQLRKMQNFHKIILKSCLNKTITKPANQNQKHTSDQSKYELYFNFENAVRYIKPHQILAINRGEKLKFLNVKIIVPDNVKNDMKYFIRKLFLSVGIQYNLRFDIFEKSFDECYTKKLQPLLSRQVRSDLNETSKKAALDVFAKNLKQLFLMSPLKGEKILGIDPGFSNGCKMALISENTEILETGVIYPHTKYGNNNFEEDGEKLAEMLLKHNCRSIALGNGTACRETEFWLTKLFEKNILDSRYIKYAIVSEQGASIYSCSDTAKKEFPNLDVNLISAISIARRLNDPLSEYVKIEPRHIGVGMYQHDINDKILTESLNEVVMECVSYVGVDINTASISVLKHISGLTELRASKIIDYRLKNGPFKTRKDILKVKNIGEKTFIQCAGFIRIEPKGVGGQVDNLLDCTWVHPESYDIAKKIITTLKLKLKDIGKPHFINSIKNSSSLSFIEKFANEFKAPRERIDVILEALQRQLFEDYRNDFDKKPLFKQGISKMSDLKKCSIVSGAVTNLTHFGAFVDIGVEHDGLIHTSNMNGMILNIGDRVDAFVIDVDVKRKRVQLKLDNITI